ncbi:hypothetical protein D5H75_12725 [Bailinhaonella thermotolerans]|uniref:Terpene synthase n=2 Tax=Bailinhaonella thermotolerans TaxID=1070861 RepID=A0A3A4B2K4_9ACTN|nr:hypothetical protein D5H75_12725 [Bailinhaonella thermotolerans]
MPFPHRINPLLPEAEAHVYDWVRRFRLTGTQAACERFDAWRIGYFASMTSPDVDRARLFLTAEFMSWLFLFDDQFDEGVLGRDPAAVDAVMEAMLDRIPVGRPADTPPSSPLQAALDDMWRQMRGYMPESWQERYRASMKLYFDAYCRETRNRLQGRIPGVEEFVEIRRGGGAMPACVDVGELAAGREVPARVLETPEYQELRLITADVVCWNNDVFSLRKELVHGECTNLVMSIAHERGVSLQEAVDEAVAMANARLRTFVEIEPQLPKLMDSLDVPPEDQETVLGAVEVMKGWIRGNYDWSVDTTRYSKVVASEQGRDPEYLERLLSVPAVPRPRSGQSACAPQP